MPWEEIGLCGGDGKVYEKEWVTLTLRMGLSYIRFMCGEAPEGCKLGLYWFRFDGDRQHEVALFWNSKLIKRAPRRYLWKCRQAVAIFDQTVPWRRLRKEKVEPDLCVPSLKEERKERRDFETAHRNVLAKGS